MNPQRETDGPVRGFLFGLPIMIAGWVVVVVLVVLVWRWFR